MAQLITPSQNRSPIREPSHFLEVSQSRNLMAVEPVAAEPNPPFVFPARPENTNYGLNPNSEARASVAQRRRKANLPSFDFHTSPGTPSSTLTPESPSHATSPSLSIPGRAAGHRRGGSEFIGGDGKANGPGLMSTSPTKGHDILPVPSARAGPPHGRRGHAHRRSGAISCHDLSVILQPRNNSASAARAGSAPTSPAAIDAKPEPLPSWSMEQEQKGAGEPSVSSPTSEKSEGSASEKKTPASNRPRVGFSDTLEFIPRPLSSLSSNTSGSSVATIRGHSASGSLSSIASGTSPGPTSRQVLIPHQPIPEEQIEVGRPKTAEASVESYASSSTGFDRSTSILKRPSSASALSSKASQPSDNPKSLLKKFSLPDCGTGSSEMLTSARYDPDNSSVNTLTAVEAKSQLKEEGKALKAGQVRKSPGRTPDLSPSKKQKKVKAWAGSILSRKSKAHQKAKSPSTRSTQPRIQIQDPLASFHFSNFDSGTTSPPSETSPQELPAASPPQEPVAGPPPAPPSLDTGFVYQPHYQNSSQGSESLSPVIDLDAALGPFKTPNLSQPMTGPGAGGFAAWRKMHSSGSTGAFSGPGMHYHRRTESAPEMVAFDAARSTLHKYGSSSTMADVFEEDEEDEEDEEEDRTSEKKSTAPCEGLGIGISVVDSDDSSPEKKMDWSAPETSRRRSRPNSQSFPAADSSSPLHSTQPSSLSPTDQAFPGSRRTLADMSDSNPITQLRPSSIAKSSDSTVTPPLPTDQVRKSHIHETTVTATPRSYFTPQTPTSTISSSFPSPDFPPTAFEPTRVITASSSFTDDPNFSSLLLGEPGPELRMSVDDVPSLTSSNSTMTSAIREPAGHFSRGSAIYGSAGESQSATNVATPRPRRATHHGKRASLVSLSRLVGSSHGEKSKLSIESRALPDSPEKRKERKPKRLSRMVDFFKAKKTS